MVIWRRPNSLILGRERSRLSNFLNRKYLSLFSISVKIVSGVRLNIAPQLHLFKNLYPEGKVLKCFYSLFSELLIPVSIVFRPVYELAKYKF